MKRIELEQGTSEWLTWRKSGVGASEAPMVMGVSPYRSALELWKEKTGQCPPQPTHPGMLRGIRLEPEARTWYENKMEVMVRPQCVEHDTIPYLKASLDGLDLFGTLFVEIKCPGKKDHDVALAGRVPYHYWVQMQYQMLVTGIQTAHYVSYDGSDGVVLEVTGDLAFQMQLQERVAGFWDCVELVEEPVVGDWDVVATNYILTLYEKETADAALKSLGEQLKTLMPAGSKNHHGSGLRAARIDALTTVNWNKVCEAALGFELDSENVARLLVTLAGKTIESEHIKAGMTERKESFRFTPEKDYLPPDMARAARRTTDPMVIGQATLSVDISQKAAATLDW